VTGATLPGRAVVWSTSAPGVATVLSSAGVVTAVAPGSATITARAGNATGTATVQVTGPNTNPWPNEPVGFTTISDQPWDLLTLQKWFVEFGTATIGIDPGAPFSRPAFSPSPTRQGLSRVCTGHAHGGLRPDKESVHRTLVEGEQSVARPNQQREQDCVHLPGKPGRHVHGVLRDAGGPYELRTITQFPGIDGPWLTPNVKNVPVTLGVWHRLEWLVVYNTTNSPPNGISRWWMDGQLIGDWRNVLFPSDAGMSVFKLSPTWGGVGGPAKAELDFYWYDHTKLSGR